MIVSDVACSSPARRSVLLERIYCVLATIALLAPFADKPLHIDDPVYVWVAKQIHLQPADFYGFQLNWYGTPQPAFDINKNPPIISYWHAGVGALGGWGERSLHAGALVWTIAAVLGTYELGRRFSRRPILAAMICLVAPAFLVSSTGLGSDVPMLALWLWAIAIWVRGLDENRKSWLAVASCLCALAALTKYFAIGLVPLLFGYTVLRRRRVTGQVAWLLIPVLSLILYDGITYVAYGHGLILDAANYASNVPRDASGASYGGFERVWVGLMFAGGAVAIPGLIAPFILRRSTAGFLAFVAVAATCAIGFHGSLGALAIRTGQGTDANALAHIAILGFGGVAVVALAVRDVTFYRDADSFLLSGAVVGTLAFSLVLNWTINSRSLLVLAPMMAIVTARGFDRNAGRWSLSARLGVGAILLAGTVIGVTVTWADWRLAWTFRQAAETLATSGGDRDRKFLGHWGFQYYLQEHGGKPLDLQSDSLRAGDILIVAENTPGVNAVPWTLGDVVARLEVPPSERVSLQSLDTRTAFYAAVRGPLPFAIGKRAKERFLALRLRGDVLVRNGAFVSTE
jgi:4-amino-4-deoxy-L-arabinose transferase-like glycosyltransferase